MPTVSKEGRIISFLLASGVLSQRNSRPTGPRDAPIKAPISTAFEVSRSFARQIRLVPMLPTIPQTSSQSVVHQKIGANSINQITVGIRRWGSRAISSGLLIIRLIYVFRLTCLVGVWINNGHRIGRFAFLLILNHCDCDIRPLVPPFITFTIS